MKYLNEYFNLKKLYNFKPERINVEEYGISIYNIPFLSDNNSRFPDKSYCSGISQYIKDNLRKISGGHDRNCAETMNILDVIDSEVQENNKFIYPVYKKNDNKKSGSVIILLHGLNEKNWDKYHTWAKALHERTGKAVLMFPISFHINRVPAAWNHPRKMDNLSKERKSVFPDIIESSFVNAAISTRLHFNPDTFFWSGLRTYFDLIKLFDLIKSGNHPCFYKDAEIDFFSYSIGAFVTEILLMNNHNNLLSDSKAFLFCGGPTMSGMYATSKYIYDSETYKSMTNFYVKNFETEVSKNKAMNQYFENPDDAAIDFKSLLTIEMMKDYRENKLMGLAERIKALALVHDEVIPPDSVIETLKGSKNKIPVDVDVMDFTYEYDHISPFPLAESIQDKVDKSFNAVFNLAGEFLE